MVSIGDRQKYVRSIDVFVIEGPHPLPGGLGRNEPGWLIAVDIGLTEGDRGFYERKPVAYELTRQLEANLEAASYTKKEFYKYDVGMEYLLMNVGTHKTDGTEIDPEALKAFVKHNMESVNQAHQFNPPLFVFVERTWLGIQRGASEPGWTIER